MQRTQVLAVVAALVAAGTAAVVFAGGASAASWHVYEGDMFAGHAYGLQVPADAETIEFAFAGEEAGKASIGVYSPAGKKVGSYALSSELTAASIADPSEGRYVVYVYDVVDGALTVRVAADDEPLLQLSEVDLVREDVTIGSFPAGRLDQAITTELKAQPVFLTLLYEGSAKDLDATVASPTGTVVTIADETASAFSPGVWTTMNGVRTFEPAGLEGTTFTVEAHAEKFEGTMVLTTLALDLSEPVAPKPPMPEISHTRPKAPDAPTAAPVVTGPSVFAISLDVPVAFEAPAGKLVLGHALANECDVDAEEYDSDCNAIHALVTLYAPDDSVLAVVELRHDQPAFEVELPVAGEYVAFARASSDDLVLASIPGARAAPAVRVLDTAEEVFEFEAASFFGAQPAELTLEHVPLALSLDMTGNFGALANARVENEQGTVASTDRIVVLGPMDTGDWTYEDPKFFAAGAHELHVGGLYEGTVTLTSTHYLRDVTAELDEVEEVDDVEEEEAADEEEEESFLPPVPVADRLLGALGL